MKISDGIKSGRKKTKGEGGGGKISQLSHHRHYGHTNKVSPTVPPQV